MTKVWQNRVIAVALIGTSLYLGNQARDFPARGGVFPIFSFACIALLSLALLITTFFEKDATQSRKDRIEISWNAAKPYLLFILVILQVALMKVLGYFITTALFIVASSLMLGIRKIRIIILTMVIIFPLFYLFFVVGLKVELPRGYLF